MPHVRREFSPPTKRRSMSKARAAKIFLREGGHCYLCGLTLRVGADSYQIEHPDSLALGGSDDDADLRVVCTPCHKVKTAADAAEKGKRDRIVTAGWTGKAKSKRGFQTNRNGPYRQKMDGTTERRDQ